jgi:L-alanine-DL-glutamate epimerase-like enolase superfamily enzyme
MCDAHGTWTVAEARRFCRAVAECDLAWLEEPVSADDKRGQAEVRAATDIPIASGESEFTRFDFRDLIELRAIDILQPDLWIAGGITEALRIEALASAHQLRFAPHLWGGALTFAAGLHVAAVASSGFILEYSLGTSSRSRTSRWWTAWSRSPIVPASASPSMKGSSRATGCAARRLPERKVGPARDRATNAPRADHSSLSVRM